MAIPTNQSAATAIPMTLPYTATQIDIDLATPTPQCIVWYRYTAQIGDTVIGFFAGEFASANYNPATYVWTGTLGSLTQYLGVYAENVPIQIPVVEGQTYYFQIVNISGVTPSASTSLGVSALRATDAEAPAGSILINDDTSGFPAALLSSSTGLPLQFKLNVVAGEAGDVLSDGTVLLENGYAIPDTTFHVYNDQLIEQTISPFVVTSGHEGRIRTHIPTDKWYVGGTGLGATAAYVTTINADGSVGPTTWTLQSAGLTSLAASNDETILYYAGSGGSTPSAVFRWDLINDIQLSNLVAGVANYYTGDMLVLSDGSLLVLYFKSTVVRDLFIRRYDATGVLLNTYSIGVTSIVLPRLASAIDGTSFWVLYQDNVNRQNQKIVNIRVSDGVVLADLTGVVFEVGVYQGTATASPSGRFGNSYSCPFMILRAAVDPFTTASIERYHTRRRVRTFPHLSSEQINAFHRALQIDMETGVGLGDPETPNAYNPQVMLDWSDDGGHTWSNVHQRTLGKMGQYRHRVFYRMLGRSRDRIYRLSMADPVRAYVIAGYLDAVEGVN